MPSDEGLAAAQASIGRRPIKSTDDRPVGVRKILPAGESDYRGSDEFSTDEWSTVRKATDRLGQANFTQQYDGKTLDSPVRLMKDPGQKSWAYTARQGKEIVVHVHPDALKDTGTLSSV